jgi:hypothetical protein
MQNRISDADILSRQPGVNSGHSTHGSSVLDVFISAVAFMKGAPTQRVALHRGPKARGCGADA